VGITVQTIFKKNLLQVLRGMSNKVFLKLGPFNSALGSLLFGIGLALQALPYTFMCVCVCVLSHSQSESLTWSDRNVL
jgi:hypothetical protein